jgi:hypothetical protein
MSVILRWLVVSRCEVSHILLKFCFLVRPLPAPPALCLRCASWYRIKPGGPSPPYRAGTLGEPELAITS